jgi:3-oxoadipate enol-lactonase/4-carboxymuconolactone decarboxylase
MFVRANGIDIHVQVSGPPGATPLLLLHSLGTSLHVWDAQADSLANSFRVIRPDMRGHGLTSVVPGAGDIGQYARDALAVLDALGVEAAHVAGLSIGGLIAQSVAIQAPARVRSLILSDTAMVIPPPEPWIARAALVREKGMEAVVDPVMARWISEPFMSTPTGQGLRAMLLRTSPEGYAAAAEAIAACDLSAQTATLNLPAVVIVGELDMATPVSSAEAMHTSLRGSKLVVLPGALHIPTVEFPEAVTAAIRSFLEPDIQDYYEAGMAVRKQVLGEAHVARASGSITEFDRDFQAFITRTAWGSVWTRPGLDRRTRSLLTIAMMASLGHHEELKLHVRASRNTGATPQDIAEVLIQVGVYGGIPAANSAVKIAKETFKEMDQ